MKHILQNSFRFLLRSKALFFCLILTASLLLGVFSTTLGSVSVYAANNTAACQDIVGKAQQPPVSANQVPSNNVFVQQCIKGYNAGYNSPNNNDTSAACPVGLGPNAPYCVEGYKQGQADKKAESNTPTPTASQIKTAAQKACKPYQDQSGVTSADRTADFNACVAGYTGQKNGQDRNTACSSDRYSGPVQVACLAGHDSAIDGRTITPGAGDVNNAPDATGGTALDNGPTSPTCESGGDPLNWIICPIFNGVAAFSDFLFTQVIEPLLTTTPLSTSQADCKQGTGNCTYQIWSNFRIYGDIFLVIALIVIVFGQSIGGGLVDAYTAKKVLPRLIIAVVLINLSIYIVAALVDITNIIGGSLGSIITQPLKDAGAFHITPSGVQAGTIEGISVAGIGLAALLFKIAPLATMGALIHAVSFAALFIIMPVVLGLLSAFITLIFRQAAILALVIVSPVAFALYCLPNTQQYFRKWWDFLVQTLLIYPIVIVIFAVSDVLSVTVNQANSDNPLAAMIAFVLQFLPLLLVPFAFRLAGGAIGRFHDVMTNYHKRGQEAVKGNANLPNSLRNRTKRNIGADLTRSRAASFRDLNSGKGFKGAIGRRLPRTTAFFTGGALEAEAGLVAQAKQRIASIKDNGDDSVVNARASWVDTDGSVMGGPAGQRYTLDGKKVTDLEYASAMSQHPTIGEMQAVAEYRAGKLTSTEQSEEFMRNYGIMSQQMGLSLPETNGAYIGFSFGKQNEFGHMKYGSYTQDPTTGAYSYHAVGDTRSFTTSTGIASGGKGSKAADFVQENYSNRSAYPAGMQHAEFHNALADTKAGYLKVLEGVEARGGQGPLTEDEQFAYDKVKQIAEMEKSWDQPISVQPDADNPDRIMPGGRGISGSPATQAAFDRLKSVGKGSKVRERIDRDLAAGRTYEVEHSPTPGDYSGGSRAYKP